MAAPAIKSRRGPFDFFILDFPMFRADRASTSSSSMYANISQRKLPDTIEKFVSELIAVLSKVKGKSHLIDAARKLISLEGAIPGSGNPNEEFILGTHFNFVRECRYQTPNWVGLRTHLDAKTSTRPCFPVLPARTASEELYEFLLNCNDGPSPTPILIGNQALRFEEYAIHPPKYFYMQKNAFMTMKANFEFLYSGNSPG